MNPKSFVDFIPSPCENTVKKVINGPIQLYQPRDPRDKLDCAIVVDGFQNSNSNFDLHNANKHGAVTVKLAIMFKIDFGISKPKNVNFDKNSPNSAIFSFRAFESTTFELFR